MSSLSTTLSPVSSAPFLLHRVSSGQSISKIITDHYRTPYGSPDYQQAERVLQYSNPEIKDLNKIYPGQFIRLMALSPGGLAYCPRPQSTQPAQPQVAQVQGGAAVSEAEVDRWLAENKLQLPQLSKITHYWPKTAQEQEAFYALAWLEHNYGVISTYAGAGLNTWGLLVSPGNRGLIAEVGHHWQQYQVGIISQNQYNYRRAKALKLLATKLGPYEQLLLKGQTAAQAIRINRSKAIPATANIMHNLNRFSRMARVAKHGGVVLSLAGAGLACHQISRTPDRHRQNEIFVETLASTLAGGFGSLALGVFVVSNPVGWVVALVAGTGVALSSYAAGRGAVKLYDVVGREVDLVAYSGVGAVCR